MVPCSGRAKGARKTHFSRLSKISCFYHAICGNDSVRPATEGHPSAAGKGGGKFWQSTGVRIPSLPLELMNNKLNNKKNELWKMKLFK